MNTLPDSSQQKAQYKAWFKSKFKRDVYDPRQKAKAYPESEAERTQLEKQATEAFKQLLRTSPMFISPEACSKIWSEVINEVTGMNGGIELSVFGDH